MMSCRAGRVSPTKACAKAHPAIPRWDSSSLRINNVDTVQHRAYLAVMVALAAVPALAQAPDSKAARDALNWDIFLKLYPPRALAAREEGAVGFAVTLDSKGEVTSCQVTHTSGHPMLDNDTCQLVTLNAQFSP